MIGNQFRGEVPFPLFGQEGVYLRFRTKDLAELRSKYGGPLNAKPEYDHQGRRVDLFWDVLFSGLDNHVPDIYLDCLRVGLKRREGDAEAPWPIPDPDDLPFPYEELAAADQSARMLLNDALLLSRWGLNTEAYGHVMASIAARTKAEREEGQAGDAPPDPMRDTSTLSESSPADTQQGSAS